MRRILSSAIVVAAFALVALVVPAATFAASTPTLNQTLNAGTLSTDILQSDDTTPVASPSVAFSAVNKSFNCQTSTGTLGNTNNRVYVTNLASNSGWTLTMAATSGNTAVWDDGTNTYDFNDPTSTGEGAGCSAGQLTVNPSVGTITENCNSSCGTASVTKGSSTGFNQGTTDAVTIMSENTGNGWKGWIGGVSLSQKIPASQTEDDGSGYTLGMTLTVTAL